ncbi:MAG TPA: Gfo/Idh/MocA family oxidoreductase [Victivallales bacterium]|nr:Gfo/Idh/MocA family oxidoreductase [Victivallales bacterium]
MSSLNTKSTEKKTEKQFTAAVIGLGNIAQGYDYSSTDDSIILTHATAYYYNESYDLLGGVDLNKHNRKRFEQKFKVRSFDCLNELMIEQKPDVISIAVPTKIHFDIFNKIISYTPKAIVCEKPIADSLSKAKKMINLARENGCVLLVNYLRRFEPGTNKLKNMISEGVFGDIYKGRVWYTKGLFNNASHFIDLLIYFFGNATKINIINKGRCWNGNDPEPDFNIEFGDIRITFLSGRHEYFEHNKFELLATKGIIKYGKGKIEYFLTEEDPQYENYTILSSQGKNIKTDFRRSQFYAFEQLANNLRQKIPLVSDGNTAIQTMNVLDKIKKLL